MPHVSDVPNKALGQFPLDGHVPVMNARRNAGSRAQVPWRLIVGEAGIDQWRRDKALWRLESSIPIEGWREAVEADSLRRCAKTERAPQAETARDMVPSGIVDAISRADHGFIVQLVSDSDPRTELLVIDVGEALG